MTQQSGSLNASDPSIYDVRTHAAGPAGKLPLDEDYLRNAPSGDLFGLTQDAGMGWDPAKLRGTEFLILGTMGGIRAADGNWNVELWGRNLADEEYTVGNFESVGQPGSVHSYVGDPRTYGISIRKRF